MLLLFDVIFEQVCVGEVFGLVMLQYIGIDQIGCKEGVIGVFIGGRLICSSVYYQVVVLVLSLFYNVIYCQLVVFVLVIGVVLLVLILGCLICG